MHFIMAQVVICSCTTMLTRGKENLVNRCYLHARGTLQLPQVTCCQLPYVHTFHFPVVSEAHIYPSPSVFVVNIDNFGSNQMHQICVSLRRDEATTTPALYSSVFIISSISSWFLPSLIFGSPRLVSAHSLRYGALVLLMKHNISVDGAYAPIRRCSPRPTSFHRLTV